MKMQKKITGIDRTLADDLLEGKNPNGYVKVCAQWLVRMWNGHTEDYDEKNFTPLKNFTIAFDECGAYDGVNGDGRSSIDKSSEHPDWNTALDFIEWFGV